MPDNPADASFSKDPLDTSRWWVGAEYLLWWFKNSPVPVALATTTSTPDLTPTAALFQEGTSVLLGNQDLDTGARHGVRFTGGVWVDSRHTVAFEAGYFIFASHTVSRGIVSNGQADAAILAVPFFDADTGAENSFVIAAPSSLAGSAVLSLTSRLQGAEINGCVRTCSGGNLRLDVLGGFRFLDLRENLSFATASLGIQEPGPDTNNGFVLNTLDQFNANNQFYGWQIGIRAEYRLGDLILTATGKAAFGDTHEVANLSGTATTNFFNAPPGGPFTGVSVQSIPGAGTFVQATNIGRTSRHEFAIVPEINLNVGYQLTDAIRVFAGYDLLFLSNVIRAGNQIDRTINSSETIQSAIAGTSGSPGSRPAVPLTGSEFWAQGVNFGLEFRY
jgi:hypothetical protein